MNKAALLLLLLVAACSRPGPPPLAGARIGAPFALTGQDGRAATDRDFSGRYRIMYFGYTYCPDVCPTDMATLAQGMHLFQAAHPAARIALVFVSVDPARDTPPVLKNFAAAFGKDVVGLTGAPDKIHALAQAYGVAYAREPGAGAAYLVSHTRAAYLMDPAGQPLALLPQEGTPQAVAGEIAKWAR